MISVELTQNFTPGAPVELITDNWSSQLLLQLRFLPTKFKKDFWQVSEFQAIQCVPVIIYHLYLLQAQPACCATFILTGTSAVNSHTITVTVRQSALQNSTSHH